MYLKTVFIRFYKSFNDDFLRKNDSRVNPKSWEKINNAFYPYMDEPDAYLSSQAQQDLLKIFDLFANPEIGSHLTQPIQVVYVTHSPFLIDKNHSERIRVLQKGNEDEGTRVVKDAARNHYEPLRSSIGAYVWRNHFYW